MEGTVFTESEVRRKLAELGYHDVPKDQMKVFMQGPVYLTHWKVLVGPGNARKRDGMVRVFDETFQEEDSEASDITLIEERLRSLPLRDDYDECQTDDSASTYSTSTRARNERGFLPSYIRPSTSRSTQGRSKTFDPVSRYHQFKEEWKLQGVPGESRHDTLRWSVREQMLNCQVYERPQHSHRPNNYQVPTKKKRQALRWENPGVSTDQNANKSNNKEFDTLELQNSCGRSGKTNIAIHSVSSYLNIGFSSLFYERPSSILRAY
eukprot:Seg2712.2 transcript_id=Seg2712.2/GoldUCD/mRNA.D3Y31 product="Hydrolethalus syndrome protein 1" protein_id=Seg2712.2/GoldUCD/D3Y31